MKLIAVITILLALCFATACQTTRYYHLDVFVYDNSKAILYFTITPNIEEPITVTTDADVSGIPGL